MLVACDFDGTMAPIVANPDDARPLTESAAAMRELAALPSTIAALISGRALRDLATLSRMPAEVHLVGSHGSEFDTGFVHGIDDAAKVCWARSRMRSARSPPSTRAWRSRSSRPASRCTCATPSPPTPTRR